MKTLYKCHVGNPKVIPPPAKCVLAEVMLIYQDPVICLWGLFLRHVMRL